MPNAKKEDSDLALLGLPPSFREFRPLALDFGIVLILLHQLALPVCDFRLCCELLSQFGFQIDQIVPPASPFKHLPHAATIELTRRDRYGLPTPHKAGQNVIVLLVVL